MKKTSRDIINQAVAKAENDKVTDDWKKLYNSIVTLLEKGVIQVVNEETGETEWTKADTMVFGKPGLAVLSDIWSNGKKAIIDLRTARKKIVQQQDEINGLKIEIRKLKEKS